MNGPLDGVRVLDLSRILAGPSATQLLGDLGADVIKVERPGRGDDTRGWGPPYAEDAAGGRGPSTYFLSANRNKRSIAIDLASDDGARLVARMAERADVLVENYKVGDLARRGLDHASLRGRCPGLVYCSITGFGQTGPRSTEAGYDFVEVPSLMASGPNDRHFAVVVDQSDRATLRFGDGRTGALLVRRCRRPPQKQPTGSDTRTGAHGSAATRRQ